MLSGLVHSHPVQEWSWIWAAKLKEGICHNRTSGLPKILPQHCQNLPPPGTACTTSATSNNVLMSENFTETVPHKISFLFEQSRLWRCIATITSVDWVLTTIGNGHRQSPEQSNQPKLTCRQISWWVCLPFLRWCMQKTKEDVPDKKECIYNANFT